MPFRDKRETVTVCGSTNDLLNDSHKLGLHFHLICLLYILKIYVCILYLRFVIIQHSFIIIDILYKINSLLDAVSRQKRNYNQVRIGSTISGFVFSQTFIIIIIIHHSFVIIDILCKINSLLDAISRQKRNYDRVRIRPTISGFVFSTSMTEIQVTLRRCLYSPHASYSCFSSYKQFIHKPMTIFLSTIYLHANMPMILILN